MITRHSLGGLFVLSLLASSFAFATGCEDGPNLDSTKVSEVPEAGPPLPDSSKTEACPAADYLAGKPIPSGGTMHGSAPGAQTWKAADSPHIIPGDTNVEFGAGTSLTIEPCALVVMGVGDSLSFDGPSSATAANLIAAGDATHPIVITSQMRTKDGWNGVHLAQSGAATVLSYVTIENAYDGHDGSSVLVTGTSAPRIDHTTVRDGKGDGIHMAGESTFGAGSGSNVITRMGARPVAMHPTALTSFPDGTYTGNADDRIEVRHEGGPIKGDVTWHKRSLPYFVAGTVLTIWGKHTIEPATHIFIGERGPTADATATFDFINGGSLVANGLAEATRIVIEGDKGKTWPGFNFNDAMPIASLTASGSGDFNFVTIKNAGGGNAVAGDPTCVDTVGPNNAVFVAHDVVDIKNTAFFDVGANNYAIGRAFCGPGGAYQTEASRNNVFHGPMHCPVTDQLECAPQVCTLPADPANCCSHPYACNGTTVP